PHVLGDESRFSVDPNLPVRIKSTVSSGSRKKPNQNNKQQDYNAKTRVPCVPSGNPAVGWHGWHALPAIVTPASHDSAFAGFVCLCGRPISLGCVVLLRPQPQSDIRPVAAVLVSGLNHPQVRDHGAQVSAEGLLRHFDVPVIVSPLPVGGVEIV